jgi:hypothetical protein
MMADGENVESVEDKRQLLPHGSGQPHTHFIAAKKSNTF